MRWRLDWTSPVRVVEHERDPPTRALRQPTVAPLFAYHPGRAEFAGGTLAQRLSLFRLDAVVLMLDALRPTWNGEGSERNCGRSASNWSTIFLGRPAGRCEVRPEGRAGPTNAWVALGYTADRSRYTRFPSPVVTHPTSLSRQ